jgi:Methyltransferase domain
MPEPTSSLASDTDHLQTIPKQLLWAEPKHLCPELVVNTTAQLTWREQTLLYALIFGLAPERVLEIGVCNGGGLRLIHAALSDLGHGIYVGLDPFPSLRIDMTQFADRASLLIGRSPEDLGSAAKIAGGLFDFVFLDGNHRALAVEADLVGLVDVTRPGTAILMHDCYYDGVIRGLNRAMRRGLPYQDCGNFATTPNPKTLENGHFGVWGGLRLLWRTDSGVHPVAPPSPSHHGLFVRLIRRFWSR